MKIAILGGGISGLSAAWFLLKKYPDAKISLFEASPRLGGWIDTHQAGPFLFEQGPRTFQTARCPELLQLIKELGLQKEVIYSDPAASRRYLWHQGKLRSLGSFWHRWIALLLRDLATSPQVDGDESVYSFGCRRFGRKATELFLDPIALGIYGGDIRKLSVRSCFSFLCDQRLCFQKRGKGGLFTLRRGMWTLIETLACLPIDIHLSCPVQKICLDGIIAKGHFHPADLVVSALPAPQISILTGILLSVHYETLTVVNLGYRGDHLPKRGYGYLVPSQEKEKLLGMIWDSAVFPTLGQTKLTAMLRGEGNLSWALEAAERHLKLFKHPDAFFLKKTAIPQYEVGHADRVAAFEKRVQKKMPHLRLTGNYLRGASVEGCLLVSKSL
ncbi:MAG: protoporphyrinogen oxidase [Verrucomicrobiota bacterium]|nr:protoporphyrinogen oxidase [Verrucomicrobiota bacterium]